MSQVEALKDKVYLSLVGEDLLEIAKEMEINIDKITDEDLEYVADKLSDGLEWWNICREAWMIWEERNK